MQLLSRPPKKAGEGGEGTGGRAAASEVTSSAGPHMLTLFCQPQGRGTVRLLEIPARPKNGYQDLSRAEQGDKWLYLRPLTVLVGWWVGSPDF